VVPEGNGFRANNDQGLFPSRPVLSSDDPKELVERGQSRSGALALQDDELLPKSQVLEPQAATSAEKANKRIQKEFQSV
jgi:hypothetical protein